MGELLTVPWNFYHCRLIPLKIKGFYLPLAGVVVMVDIVAVVVGFVVISGVVTLVGANLVVLIYVVGLLVVLVVVVGCSDVV